MIYQYGIVYYHGCLLDMWPIGELFGILTYNNMKINTKDNIWIEGFDSEIEAVITGQNTWFGENFELFVYAGKTSEIPEEIAKEILKIDDELSSWEDVNDIFYVDYKFGFSHSNFNDSIQSACNQEYCIIYKTLP